MKMVFIADDVTLYGEYDFVVSVTFPNYDALDEVEIISSSFTVVVTNYPRCMQAYYKNTQAYLYETQKLALTDSYEGHPCNQLNFQYTLTNGKEMPYFITHYNSILTIEPLYKEDAGSYELDVYVDDQFIGNTYLDTFKITIV